MGYYTRYELSYELPEEDNSSAVNEFIQECREKGIEIPADVRVSFDEQLGLEIQLEQVLNQDDFGEGYGPLINFVNGNADSCKWYDHEKDMIQLSKLFPSVKFTLRGEGEEAGDLWIRYFLDGKKQVCQARIVFDEFDPEKLQEVG